MVNRAKFGLWAGAAALSLWAAVPTAAQEPAPAQPANPSADAKAAAVAAQLAGAKAFKAGAAAYDRRDYAAALTHYAEALKQFRNGWPNAVNAVNAANAADADTARVVKLQVWRARAHAHAQLGDTPGFLADARAALRLIGAVGGDSSEEQALQAALFACLNASATKELGAKLTLLTGYRQILQENLPSNQTDGRGLARRLRIQIGQVMHEVAFAQDRAGRLDDAAAALQAALDYRLNISDLTGAGWSSQNLFWNLLRRREFDAAAKQFGDTVKLLGAAPSVDIEGSLVANLENWCSDRVKEKTAGTARTLLTAIRKTGALNKGGLPSFTLGRLCAMELALTAANTDATRTDRFNLAELLVIAGKREAQPAWSWLGHATRVRAALELWAADPSKTGSFDMLAEAKTARLAAVALQDRHRVALADLLVADVLLAGARTTEAEAQVHAVLKWASIEGAEPWMRELARRKGVALLAKAADAANAEWAERYKLHATPKHPGVAGGHTIMGRTADEFFRTVAALPGEGAVLTITRRGNHLILRSPLFPGTLAVEWGWRLRYVNANGILLAVQGPAVAVIGKHPDVTAPTAQNGTSRPDGNGGLDLAALRGDQLPPMASQSVVPPGETLFVNKYLRVFR